MSRPRSGIGAELAPLVLILAGLAGSLALIVAVHRRASAPRAPMPVVAVAPSPAPPPPKPAPITAPAPVAEPEPDEPEPPPPPPPEDPTPKAIAKLTSAEAEQLLEASKADRRVAALIEARKAAELESERWRRRNSLVKAQLDTLDSKLRKMESDSDELALERDALEQELDARKAMAAKAQTRPSTAILPHRGQNGTWRRPIVVECANGMATLQPQGIGFGLLELSSGFGPAANPFVAVIAREAIRIQRSGSPDGQEVVPYIFFLVRPDGIRAYYEARGRLEPLGITFGYELADQDWEIDFPDLDDIKTWDGSPATLPDSFVKKQKAKPPEPGSSDDDEFPSFELPRRSAAQLRGGDPGADFSWPRQQPRRLANGVSVPPSPTLEPMRGAPTPRSGGLRFSNSSENRGGMPSSPGTGPGPMPVPGTSNDGADADTSQTGVARVALGGAVDGQTTPSGPAGGGSAARPIVAPGASPSFSPLPLGEGQGVKGEASPVASSGGPIAGPNGPSTVFAPPPARSGTHNSSTPPKPLAPDDPDSAFVLPSKPPVLPSRRSTATATGSDLADGSPPVRHVGPFSRPLAMGLDSVPQPGTPPSASNAAEADPTQPDGGSEPDPSGSRGTAGAASSDTPGIGQGGSPNVQPPPGSIGLGTPGTPAEGDPPSDLTPPPDLMPPPGQLRPKWSPLPPPEVSRGSVVDRRFEVVLVCGPRGVIVQPGAYRVTTDALKSRDGLLRKEIVALVKAKRAADPKTTIEPRVRFLVQPGGEKNYWTARGQFLVSGFDWPVSTQVAGPDQLTLLPTESW